MQIFCHIVSVHKSVYKGYADIVILPTVNGQIGVMARHARLLAALTDGIITVRDEQGSHEFTVTGGFAQIEPNEVLVLANASEHIEEIDLERAEVARAHAEVAMKEAADKKNTVEYQTAVASLRHANLRMKAARRKKGQ